MVLADLVDLLNDLDLCDNVDRELYADDVMARHM